MPEHLVRIYQTHLLLDSADIVLQAAKAGDAAHIAIDAANGNFDDGGSTRSYRLPDGQMTELDPEEVGDGETYAETIVDGMAVRTVGRSEPLELDANEYEALRCVLNEAIIDTGCNRKAALFTSVLRKLGSEGVRC